MKRVSLILVALLLLLPAANAAEQAIWTPSLKLALQEAKERGSLIFIAMFVPNEADNDAQVQQFADPAFVKASKDFVCLMACPEPTWATVQVDGQTRLRMANSIAPNDLVTAWQELRRDYADLNTDSTGGVRIPFNFVVDADGKVVAQLVNGTKEGGFGAVTADDLAGRMAELVRKHGKGLTSKEYQELTEDLVKAEKAAKAGDHREAMKLIRKIVGKNSKTKVADRAKALELTLSEAGNAKIEKAAALAEKDPIGAVLALEEIAEEYEGSGVEKAAKARIAELKKSPEVKAALADVARRREAEKEFGKVEEAISRKQYAKALGMLDKIARKFEGTPVEEQARAKEKEIRDDPVMGPAALEQEAGKDCKGWLSMGRSFAKNGMKDQARAQFEKIIAKYPGTSFAREAEKELAKLR